MKKRIWLNIVGFLIICLHISPIYLTLTSSLKVKTDLSSKWVLPVKVTMDNFRLVLSDPTFIRAMINTMTLVIGSLLIIVVIGSLTGYVLARLKTRVTNIMLMCTLAVMMVPSISLIVPLYKMMIDFKLINTIFGAIILISTYSLPLCIFIYTNFIKSIPQSLDEAAQIDGCGIVTTFFKIIFPQLGPVTASVIILSGVKIYNNYIFPLYFLQGPNQKVATTYVTNFFEEYPQLNQASAALLSAVPVVLVYILLQKYFVQGALEGIEK